MILLNIFGVLTALFAVIYTYTMWIFQTFKRKNIPYFEPRFPIGNRDYYFKKIPLGDEVFNTVEKARKMGWNYFGLFITASPFFVPLDLEIVKNILVRDFNHFTDRGFYYNEKDDPTSAHLVAIGGVKWRNLRTKLNPTFTSGKMRRMIQTVVDCGTVLEKYLQEHVSSEPLNVRDFLASFSADVIGSCAFGLDCNTFEDKNSPFIVHGRTIFVRNFLRQLLLFFQLSFPKLALALRMRALPKSATDFFTDVVTTAVNYREQHGVTRNDFLQILIESKNSNLDQVEEGDGRKLTLKEIIAQCMIFFSAGFETSSTTMTFALYELSIHPEMQEKVREEIFRMLNKYDNKISYDSLKELEYMQQVLEETMRKYPPAVFITRVCVKDYKIPDTNIMIEKGMRVLIPIQNIHYDEKIYENPTVFDPERFNQQNKQTRNQYAYIPFGEGPRICIGMRFAIMELKVALISIFRGFRVTLNPKTKTPFEMESESLTPSPKGGVWLDFEKI